MRAALGPRVLVLFLGPISLRVTGLGEAQGGEASGGPGLGEVRVGMALLRPWGSKEHLLSSAPGAPSALGPLA